MPPKKVRCKEAGFCRLEGLASLAVRTLPSAHPSQLVFADVPHELRLQFLGAELAANVQRAFAVGDIFVPRAQIQRRLVHVLAGCPHQPPAVGALLEEPAVGAGTAVKRVRDGVSNGSQLHGSERSSQSPPILAGIPAR
jgi:hypothetical protein